MARLPGIKPLPGLGTRKKKALPEREYSVDLKKERRKRKRIGIEELSAKSAEFLREHGDELKKPDSRSSVTKVLDLLDVPRNLIANAIAKLSGMDTSKKREGTLAKKVYASDLLAHLGVEKGAARSVAGFIGDVALDPLTYASLGSTTGTSIARHLPKILKPGMKMLKSAGKTGQIAPDLVKALGPKNAARIQKAFGRIAAKKGTRAAVASMKGIRTHGKYGTILKGPAVQRRLIKAAGRGEKGALGFLATHGEKGRSLFRLPGASKGFPVLKFGSKAHKHRKILEAASAAGQAKSAGLKAAKVKEVGSIIRQGTMTAEAAKTTGIVAARAAKEDAVRKALAAVKRAEKAAREVKYPGIKGTRPVIRTHAVREAERNLQIAKDAPLKAFKGDLGQPFQITDEALEKAGKAAGQIGEAKAALSAARKTAPRVAIPPKLRARFETPVGLAKMEKRAAVPLKAKAKELAAGAVEAGEQSKLAKNEIKRILTGPDAPPVLELAREAQIGRNYTRNAPGIANKLRQLKGRLLGPSPTPVGQQMVAAEQAYTVGAGAKGLAARQALSQALEPEIARLVTKTGRTAEDLRTTIAHLVEAGPGGHAVMSFRTTPGRADPLVALVNKSQDILGDEGLRKVLGNYFDEMARIQTAEKAAGASVGALPGYKARIPTKEARIQTGMQEARGFGQSKPRPSRFGPQGPSIGRGHWQVFQMPDGSERHVLSTTNDAKNKIGAIRAEGGKQVREELVSEMQWNQWARNPEATRGMQLGPDFGGAPAFKGDMFEADLAKSAGKRAAQHEQTIAAQQARGLVEQYGVDLPVGAAGRGDYAHLAVPNKPIGDGPFTAIANETGMFERAYPTPVADLIDRMTAITDNPQNVNALLEASDRYLGLWKSFQLYHPAFVIRNIFQNFFGGLMAGANPGAVAKHWATPDVRMLGRALREGNPEMIAGKHIVLRGERVPAESLFKFAQRFHGAGAGRTAQEVPATFAGLSQLQKAGHMGRRAVNKAHGAIFKWNSAVEDGQRLSTWLHFMDRGMDAESAFMQTLKAMPDLADLSHWERSVGKRMFPWWAWMRKNGALQLFEYLPKKPVYAASLPRFKNFMEGFMTKDQVPEELRPLWMQEQSGIQMTGDAEGGRAFLSGSWFPFEDMYALGAPLVSEPKELGRRALSAMRPELKALTELGTGKSVFKQTPLGQPTLQDIPRSIMGKSDTALDSVMALRPAREWLPGGRVSQMPGLQAKAERVAIGGAIQPVDRQRGLMGKYYELEAKQRQLRAQYNRALQVGDQAMAENLFRQFLEVQKLMWEYKMPISRRMEGAMQSAGVPSPGAP